MLHGTLRLSSPVIVVHKTTSCCCDRFAETTRLQMRRGSFNASGELLGPVAGEEPQPPDTFLRMPGFTKGVAFVNGFNLGWCSSWPLRAHSRLSTYCSLCQGLSNMAVTPSMA